jgi:aldehyde dehydrogenase (NAD+)
VLNLVLGSGSTIGDTLVASPDVDAVSFTGSNAVGRAIRSRAADHDKRIQLELGGKNPAIVLADADLDLASAHIARAAFYAAGQKCTATSRIIVERSVLEPFRQRLQAFIAGWTLGDPLDPATTIGPLASADQRDRVRGYLEIARKEGAENVAVDHPLDGLDGYYIPPTLLTDVPRDSRVAREEIFGPVAVISTVDSYAEAAGLANDTSFGLTASLFTADLARALEFSRTARVGIVKINQETTGLEHQAPFGGMSGSSFGPREQGKAAREFYTQWKVVYADPGVSA